MASIVTGKQLLDRRDLVFHGLGFVDAAADADVRLDAHDAFAVQQCMRLADDASHLVP